MADRLLSLSVTNCHDRVVSVYTVCCRKTLATLWHSRRRREMCIGHAHLCFCVPVPRRIPTLLHGPGCNLEEW